MQRIHACVVFVAMVFALNSLWAGETHTPTPQGQNIAPDDRFKGLVRQTLLDNPEILKEALENLQKSKEKMRYKQQSKSVHMHIDRVHVQTPYPILGNKNAVHTVVGFFDPQCGHCVHMLKDMVSYVSKNVDVKVIVRDIPFLGESSDRLAELSFIAYKQGKYPAILDDMARDEGVWDGAKIQRLLEKHGLNANLSPEDREGMTKAIAESRRLAADLKIDSTPTFIVGTRVYSEYRGVKAFDKIVTSRLRQKREEKQERAEKGLVKSPSHGFLNSQGQKPRYKEKKQKAIQPEGLNP